MFRQNVNLKFQITQERSIPAEFLNFAIRAPLSSKSYTNSAKAMSISAYHKLCAVVPVWTWNDNAQGNFPEKCSEFVTLLYYCTGENLVLIYQMTAIGRGWLLVTYLPNKQSYGGLMVRLVAKQLSLPTLGEDTRR